MRSAPRCAVESSHRLSTEGQKRKKRWKAKARGGSDGRRGGSGGGFGRMDGSRRGSPETGIEGKENGRQDLKRPKIVSDHNVQ